MVEQCPFKAMVEGSSPSGVTILEIARNVGAASAAPTSDLISFSVSQVVSEWNTLEDYMARLYFTLEEWQVQPDMQAYVTV